MPEALRPVRTVEHCWVEMNDGVRLGARLLLPDTSEPVPAVVEYIPYRKDDGTLLRDNRQHRYLAERGFAMIRVDIRGSGDSDGVLTGEYLATELDDGVQVVDWVSRQPWCNGRVGMMGISWGGFNALQIAALAPPALGAVVAVAATDDRYATDVHYIGGCVSAVDMLSWSATMACFNARPPTPRILRAEGMDWRAEWRRRLEDTPIFVPDWLSHQRRDGFWEHGSVCENYGAIRCPVMTVGGLADGYTDTVFRLAEGLSVPYRAIVGPWSHNYPAVGVPGPNIGFLDELVDWFDLHLGRGHPADGPVTARREAWAEAPVRIWIQDRVSPSPYHPERPGRWAAEPSWPSPNVSMTSWWLTADRLVVDKPESDTAISAGNSVAAGLGQGSWWGYAAPGQLPVDQRTEHDPAFRFDGPTLDQPVDLVGIPSLALRLAVDAPVAQVAARLCDVGPDGSMLQISRGVLNLTHRHSHAEPSAMEPGDLTDVVLGLDGLAHRVPAGHRLSLLLTTNLWPLVWPSPTEVELTLATGPSCELRLPVRTADADDADHEEHFGPPVVAPDHARFTVEPTSARTVTSDVATGTFTVRDHSDAGTIVFDDHGTAMSSTATDTWTITDGDPLSARVVCERQWSVTWPEDAWPDDGQAAVTTRSEMWCDAAHFHTSDVVTTHLDGEPFFTRSHEFSVERDLG